MFWLPQPKHNLDQKSPFTLTGQVPAGTNKTRLEMDPVGIAYLGHADHQVPCGLRPPSGAAVRPDLGREDQLEGLQRERVRHGEQGHLT